MGRISKTIYQKQFSLDGGVDQFHDPVEIKDNRLQSANNIHIDGDEVFKRPGKLRWGGASNVEFSDGFNGVHEYIDSSGTQHILVASGTSLYEVTSTSKTARDTIVNEDIHFHTLRGKCFYNGLNTQRKIEGTTASDVGLASPTTTATVATGAAGVLTGNYAVRITFVIESGGIRVSESSPSTVSNSITLTSQQLSLTAIPTSLDSRVNARYIYRTTAGGAKYYYTGKISDNTTTVFSDNVPDANIGDEVEYTHGQPTQGSVSEGCNERQFWITENTLYYSEISISDAYLEYSNSTNFITLPNNGQCVGLKRLYNQNTGREDLYIFQEDAISILPNGDPNQPIYTAIDHIGLLQHDTIVEYNGWLVFMTQKNSIGMIKGGAFLDVTSRNIPNSIKTAYNKNKARSSLIFDNYYAITTQNEAGKGYNKETWICDLRRVVEVENGQADAVWFPYEFNTKYYLQINDNTVLMFDSLDGHIYTIDLANKYDEDKGGNQTDITTVFRTKNFDGGNIIALKQPRLLALSGRFESNVIVTPYAYKSRAKAVFQCESLDNIFVMGVSRMGQPITNVKDLIEAPIPSGVVGNTFSFEFKSETRDSYFSMSGMQYTIKQFGRML